MQLYHSKRLFNQNLDKRHFYKNDYVEVFKGRAYKEATYCLSRSLDLALESAWTLLVDGKKLFR
jgi:hypothetical protein